jgi:hypothetical protein
MLKWSEFTPGFSGIRVTRSLCIYVCFVDRCLSFCTFSFGRCVVSSLVTMLLAIWRIVKFIFETHVIFTVC